MSLLNGFENVPQKASYTLLAGLEINEKIQSQFCDKIRKFSRNFANFSRKIATLHCVVSGLAKKNMSPQYLCVKKPLRMANDRRNGAVHVTSQLNYSTITLSEKIHSCEKQNNFVIYLLIYLFIYLFILAKVAAKVATANPFVSKERR